MKEIKHYLPPATGGEWDLEAVPVICGRTPPWWAATMDYRAIDCAKCRVLEGDMPSRDEVRAAFDASMGRAERAYAEILRRRS